MKLKLFSVKGTGHFPYDMLRYDHCYPATPDDTLSASMNRKERVVNLKGTVYPTEQRWKSFGWKVIGN